MTHARILLCAIATATAITLVPVTGAWAQQGGRGGGDSSEGDTGARIAMPPRIEEVTRVRTQARPQRVQPKKLSQDGCAYEYVAVTSGPAPIYERRCRGETPQ